MGAQKIKDKIMRDRFRRFNEKDVRRQREKETEGIIKKDICSSCKDMDLVS